MKVGLSEKGYTYLKARIEACYKLNALEGSPWKINAMESSNTYSELKRLIGECIFKKMEACWINCPSRNVGANTCRKIEGPENITSPDYEFPCAKERQKNNEDSYYISTRTLMEFLYNKKMRFRKGFLASCFLFIGEDIDEVLKNKKEYFDFPHSDNNVVSIWKITAIVFLVLLMATLLFILWPISTTKENIKKEPYIISYEAFHKATADKNWKIADALTTANWKRNRRINNENDFLREYRLTDNHFFIAYSLKEESIDKNHAVFWACYAYANKDEHMPERNSLSQLKLSDSLKLEWLINLTRKEIEEKISMHYVVDDSNFMTVRTAINNLTLTEMLRQEVADVLAFELGLIVKNESPEIHKLERIDKYKKIESKEMTLNTVCHLVNMVRENGIWRVDAMRNPDYAEDFK